MVEGATSCVVRFTKSSFRFITRMKCKNDELVKYMHDCKDNWMHLSSTGINIHSGPMHACMHDTLKNC